MPTLEELAAGGRGDTKDPLAAMAGTGSGKDPLKDMASGGSSRRRTTEEVRRDVAAKEAEAREAGLIDPPGVTGAALRTLGAFFGTPLGQGLADLVRRPGYAAVGVLEEAFAPGQTAPFTAAAERAGREILSGIPGVQGEKRGGPEALERAGVGEMGRLSDLGILPSQETAATLGAVGMSRPDPGAQIVGYLAQMAYPGGPLDITGRTALGLAGETAVDPTTYLGPAFKGPKVLTDFGVRNLSKAGTRLAAKEVERLIPKAIREAEEAAFRVLPEGGQEVAERAAGKVAEATVQRQILGAAEGLTEEISARQSVQRALLEGSEAYADMVNREASNLLSAGIKRGSPLWREMTREAQAEALARVAQAANAGQTDLLRQGGIAFMGVTIPGTPGAGTAVAAPIAATYSRLRSAPFIGNVVEKLNSTFDSTMRMFSVDWRTRNFQNFNAKRDELAALKAADLAEYVAPLEASDAVGWYTSPLRSKATQETFAKELTDKIESGNLVGATAREVEMGAIERDLMDRIAAIEVGDYGAEYVPRTNYVAHFYRNKPIEMAMIFDHQWIKQYGRRTGRDFTFRAGLGRHGEERVFDTFADAMRFHQWRVKELGHTWLPALEPVYDPIERIVRRLQAHVAFTHDKQMISWLEREFAGPIKFDIKQRYALEAPVPVGKLSAAQTKEYLAIRDALKAGGTKVEQVSAWSPDGRAEFLRQRLGQVRTSGELGAVLKKYGKFADDFPPSIPPEGLVDDAGRVMRPVRIIEEPMHVYVPQEIAEVLTDKTPVLSISAPEETGKFLRAWDKASRGFKIGVYSIWPASAFRNVYSNQLQMSLLMGLGALDVRDTVKAIKVLDGGPGIWRSKLGAEYTYDELREIFRKHGIIRKGAAFQDYSGALPPFRGSLMRTIENVTGFFENEGRVHIGLHYLDQGFSPAEAAAQANKALFNYQKLTWTEKQFFRRLIPFYTWPKKNLKFQLERAIKQPGRLAMQDRIFGGRESENRNLTSWEGDAYKLVLERDAKTLRVITGIDPPVRNLDNLWAGSFDKSIPRLMGQLHPFVKAPMEIGLGAQFFTGREFGRKRIQLLGPAVAKLPKPVRDFVSFNSKTDPVTGKTTYTMDEEAWYVVFQTWALSRTTTTSDRVFRSLVDDPVSAKAFLDVLTGLRDKELNLDDEQRKRLLERERYLDELLYRAGRREKFEVIYKPKGQ